MSESFNEAYSQSDRSYKSSESGGFMAQSQGGRSHKSKYTNSRTAGAIKLNVAAGDKNRDPGKYAGDEFNRLDFEIA